MLAASKVKMNGSEQKSEKEHKQLFFLWAHTSLRGRRLKGKGKGIRARDHARGRREEGGRERLQGSHCFRLPAY